MWVWCSSIRDAHQRPINPMIYKVTESPPFGRKMDSLRIQHVHVNHVNICCLENIIPCTGGRCFSFPPCTCRYLLLEYLLPLDLRSGTTALPIGSSTLSIENNGGKTYRGGHPACWMTQIVRKCRQGAYVAVVTHHSLCLGNLDYGVSCNSRGRGSSQWLMQGSIIKILHCMWTLLNH